MKDLVTIGIPTYNGWQRVENLLNNLNQRTEKNIPHDIVVCDDSGKKEHQDKVRAICKKWGARFVFHEKNRGVPSSWNTLVKSSKSEYIILLNDDILVANHWLNAPWHALKENPAIGSFGLHCYFISPSDVEPLLAGPDAKIIPLNVRWDGPNLILNERFPELPSSAGSVPGRMMCPTGCAFGFRRTMWERVGGFNESLFAFYEETMFGCDCALLGFPSVQLPCPGNYHIWSQTFASAPEINAGKVMSESKNIFLTKWRKILGVELNDAPDIHPFLMDKIGPIEIQWIDENELQHTSII